LSTLHCDGLVYPIPVVVEGFGAHMQLEVRKLGKYYIVEVVALQRKTHRIVESHVYELTLFLVDDIVVADQLLVPLSLAHLVGLVGDAT